MRNSIPSFLLQKAGQSFQDKRAISGHGRPAFLDRGLLAVSRLLKDTYVQWDLSAREGLFQCFDPRLKLFFLIFFAVAISLKRDLLSEIVVMAILLTFSLLSRLPLAVVYSRVITLGLVFGGLVSFPSACNVIVPGRVIAPLVSLTSSYDLLFYHIPQTIGFTREGLYLVALLSLRVINSLTVCMLVLYTTPFPDLIKALRLLHVPTVVILIITLFHKYVFILACSLEEMHLAMKSRLMTSFTSDGARTWAADRMAYIYRKTHRTCEDVFGGMLSRGFTGEVQLIGSAPLSRVDWLAGSALLAVWFIVILL